MFDDKKDLNLETQENKDETQESNGSMSDDEIEKVEAGIVPGLTDVDMAGIVKSSFLDYAMSVIVSRAIPDVRDGFKPVHRRIIFGMNESGMTPNTPHKKCARIVGDVMGKYHPHGDAAIYSTLVRLAQPFSMRYILVDGHGNFGSVDGDEAAAMRYTEARMSKLAMEMVRDIDDNTVEFVDNYDGSEKEPSVLPSRFPNLLVNGSSGIAVGMATNIPTHNIGETIDAVVAISKNPEMTPLEIMNTCLFGPDFPTGGTILGRDGIKDAYETGVGTIYIRSKAHIEENDLGKKRIIVTEIPYQVNKAKMIEGIALLVKDKIIDGITDVRDESNKEGIRVVIEVRRDVIPEVIINQLYKHTQLQISYGIIMLCLDKGEPKVMSITDILKKYLEFQIEVVERRTHFLLDKDEARDHIVVGLLTAIDNIDDVINLIRKASTPEEAAKQLNVKYGLDDLQSQAILAMTFRRLTGLESKKLVDERAELDKNISYYKNLLSSRQNIIDVVVNELIEIKNRFGDERKTEITSDLATIEDESLIPEEEIVITLTKNGYIKRLTTDTFRTQNRGGRGVKGMSTNENDVVSILLHTKTHTDILFFTNTGKVYRLRGYVVPESGRNSKGFPVQNLLNLEKDEKVMSIIALDEYSDSNFLFFITKRGIVKRTKIEEYKSIRQNGKIAISLREGDQLLDVKHTNGECVIGIASSQGKMASFNERDVRSMGRTASGVKGMSVSGDAEVVAATTSLEGSLILAITQKGYGKMSEASDYRLTKRGTKGVLTVNATPKNGKLVSVHAVKGDEDLMVITASGIVIRIPLSQIKISGRNTQGVRVIRLEDRQKVSSIAIVPHEDEIEGDEVIDAVQDQLETVETDSSEDTPFENTELGKTDE
jgi:DNA gyrase subunit A